MKFQFELKNKNIFFIIKSRAKISKKMKISNYYFRVSGKRKATYNLLEKLKLLPD